MAPRPVKIASLAGIKRDGTQFEGDYYVDGQWCRFQRKLPRKMGGYRQLSNNISGLARGVFTQTDDNTVYMHIGSSDLLERITVSVQSGVASAVTDRTPADDLYRELLPALADRRLTCLRLIGDAEAPGLIAQAVFSGHLAAREFGEPPADGTPFAIERVAT